LGVLGTALGTAGVDTLATSPHLASELELQLDGEWVGLERETWLDQGVDIGWSWRGTASPQIAQRFRLSIPSYGPGV
jgi:hypothetical protein